MPLGSHAIVIGAGMGGLIAARALANHFDRITILERDVLPTQPDPRKGVPHGRHAHGLLARGREVLEEMFPGLTSELVDNGAVAVDTLGDTIWFNHGVYLAQTTSGLKSILLSRPLLETHVRRRLLADQQVTIRERTTVRGLAVTGGRVIGAELVTPGEDNVMAADLVVDASGRHSHAPEWLEALGYAKPSVETVEVGISYTTRRLRRRPEHLGGKCVALSGAQAPNWRFGVALATENDEWIVTQGGYFDDRPEDGHEGFRDFARSLAAPDIADLLATAEMLTPAARFAFPESKRRGYERLRRFPEGYLVFGDSLCSFNPIYGQGMTAAALEGLVLNNCLRAGMNGLSSRFFAKASRIIDTPWQIAVGSDLQHPRLSAQRTPMSRFMNWYIGKVHRAGAIDPAVATAFLQVANLTDPPGRLFAPAMVSRVIAGNLRQPAAVHRNDSPALRRSGTVERVLEG
jgi:2-polyprenyl-6-methoxyphenol hydroxylase-like FAD-dependent oxidoreductase